MVMSETLTLQPLQLQSRHVVSTQYPARSFLQPHLPCGRGQGGRKNRHTKVSPLGICTWGEGLVCLVTFLWISLGGTGSDRTKCPLSVSGSSGEAVVSVGLRHFIQIHMRCLGKALWMEQQQHPSVVGVSHRMSQHRHGHRILSQILNPLPLWGLSPSSNGQIEGRMDGWTEASPGGTQAASRAHPF